MTGESLQFIFSLGSAQGQLMRCTDEDLVELLAWAKTAVLPEFPYTEIIEAEKRRRTVRP